MVGGGSGNEEEADRIYMFCGFSKQSILSFRTNSGLIESDLQLNASVFSWEQIRHARWVMFPACLAGKRPRSGEDMVYQFWSW